MKSFMSVEAWFTLLNHITSEISMHVMKTQGPIFTSKEIKSVLYSPVVPGEANIFCNDYTAVLAALNHRRSTKCLFSHPDMAKYLMWAGPDLWWCRSRSRGGTRGARGGVCGAGWRGSPAGRWPSTAARSKCVTTCGSGWWAWRRWPGRTRSNPMGTCDTAPLQTGKLIN